MLGRGSRKGRPLGGQGGQLDAMDVEPGLCEGGLKPLLFFWLVQ